MVEPNFPEVLEYIGKELEVESEVFNERHRRQTAYLQIYIVALGALLATAAFGATSAEKLDSLSKVAFGIVGTIIWFLILAAGCCYTVFLGHNLKEIIISRKNIAGLRGTAASIGTKVTWCSEIDPRRVRLHELYSNGNLYMALLNGAIATGCPYFLQYCFGSWISAIIFSCVVWGIFITWIYPRVYLAYNRYMFVASKITAKTSENDVRALHKLAIERWRNQRKILRTRCKVLNISMWILAVLYAWWFKDIDNWVRVESVLWKVCAVLCVMLLILSTVKLLYENTPLNPKMRRYLPRSTIYEYQMKPFSYKYLWATIGSTHRGVRWANALTVIGISMTIATICICIILAYPYLLKSMLWLI
jgi:hypothetical protein